MCRDDEDRFALWVIALLVTIPVFAVVTLGIVITIAEAVTR